MERNLAGSGSFARGDQSRSVPDLGSEDYEAMAQWQRAYNEEQSTAQQSQSQPRARTSQPTRPPPDPEHSLPDAATAHFTKVLGFAREARGKWERGDKAGAALDAALGLPDVYVDGSLLKSQWKIWGPKAWHTPPWQAPGVRKWMKNSGLIGIKEHGHHAYIPQGGWGKRVPGFIKNQPWNIKPLDPITHRRVHSRARVDGVWLPRFNRLERFWYGTTPFAKGLLGSALLDAPAPSAAPPSPARPAAPPRPTAPHPAPPSPTKRPGQSPPARHRRDAR